MTDLSEFIERLSSADPVPGGGSVAALECAMGAALLVMVSNLTLGRKKYAAVEDQISKIRSESSQLMSDALQLAEDDIAAYGRVAAVLAMPKATDEEKSARRDSMQAALKGAVAPPLATMKVAVRILELAEDLVLIGNSSAVSDVGTAAGSARAGYDAALLNVEINLASIADSAWVDGIRSELSALPPADVRAGMLADRVLAAIRS